MSKLQLIILYLISTIKNQIINSNKIVELKNNINTFISKYKSQNCIIEVFTSLETQCDNISDNLMMELSYKLSICSLSKFGKSYPICDSSNGVKNCIKDLKGDLWTTYSTFYQQIENICFYYKILKWEKSTDIILSNLILSSELAENIINWNKNFSEEFQRNFTHTINQLNSLNDFMKNYSETEKLIKLNLKDIENTISKNKEHYNQIIDFVKKYFWFFGGFLNNEGIFSFIKFFAFLFFFELFLGVFILDCKIKLILLYLCFLIYEIYIVQIFSNLIYFSIIIAISRLFYYIILLIVIITEKIIMKKENKVYVTYSQIKNIIQYTPHWVKNLNKIKNNQPISSYINSNNRKNKNYNYIS